MQLSCALGWAQGIPDLSHPGCQWHFPPSYDKPFLLDAGIRGERAKGNIASVWRTTVSSIIR